MNLIKVGKLIAQIRKEKGLTQEELAEKFNISGKSVSKWERGINAPDISILESLSEELGITVNELLSGEKNVSNIQNDKITVDSINYYNNKFKHRSLIIFALIVIFLILLFSLLFTINNFNKCSIYSLDSNDENISINGFIIFNQLEKIIIINNIKYNDEYEMTNKEKIVKNVNIRLISKDKVIFYLYDDQSFTSQTLSSVVDSISINLTDSNNDEQNLINKDDIDNLYILIEYDDINNQRNIIEYKLKCKQKFSTNKLFY